MSASFPRLNRMAEVRRMGKPDDVWPTHSHRIDERTMIVSRCQTMAPKQRAVGLTFLNVHLSSDVREWFIGQRRLLQEYLLDLVSRCLDKRTRHSGQFRLRTPVVVHVDRIRGLGSVDAN